MVVILRMHSSGVVTLDCKMTKLRYKRTIDNCNLYKKNDIKIQNKYKETRNNYKVTQLLKEGLKMIVTDATYNITIENNKVRLIDQKETQNKYKGINKIRITRQLQRDKGTTEGHKKRKKRKNEVQRTT